MKHQLQTIRAALEIGRDAAQQVAEHYHVAMAGYAPDHHKALDDDVIRLDKALTALSELERMAGEPVAWASWSSSLDPAKHAPSLTLYKPSAYTKMRPLVFGDTPPAQQPQAEAVHCTRADLDRAYSAGLVEGERLAPQQAEAVPSDVVRDAMIEAACDAVAAALGDAYDCTRVWEAWKYGTMGPDDFSQVSEDCDRVREIAVAAIDAAMAQGEKP